MMAKKQVKLFVCWHFMMAVMIAGTNYVVDPFHLFRKSI